MSHLRGIWVGNVPWGMDAYEFFALWPSRGPNSLPEPVSLRFGDSDDGKGRGEKYAVVRFQDWNDAELCLQRQKRWRTDPLPYFPGGRYMLIRPLCHTNLDDNLGDNLDDNPSDNLPDDNPGDDGDVQEQNCDDNVPSFSTIRRTRLHMFPPNERNAPPRGNGQGGCRSCSYTDGPWIAREQG